MQVPLQIIFHDMPHSDAIETRIREKVQKLEQIHTRITSCRVTVESPHQHHNKGKIYRVVIDIVVPGGEVVVGRSPGADHAHEDAYVAVRDAFEAATRQLKEYNDRRQDYSDRRQDY